MAKVIALYVAKNGRVTSPKFLLGESYGGFRAAKVARALQSEQGIAVGGILMLSPMLEGAFQFGGDRFALGAALRLPSLAAAELERKGTFSKEALAQAEHFALTDYLTTFGRAAAARRCGEEFLCARRGDDRAVAGCRGGIARLYLRRLRQKPAAERPQDRQPLRRDLRDRRSGSGIADGARPRSDPRWRRALLWQRFRLLCARRARLQNRHDLQSARFRYFRRMEMGRGPRAAERRRRFACAAVAHAYVPADDQPTATATWSRPTR